MHLKKTTMAIDKQKDKLQQILSSHLKKEIACHEDYFKSGGTSLQAISITNEINEKFDADFTIVDFYFNSSVDEFYKLLTNANDSESEKTLSVVESLSEDNSVEKDTIILFPPIVGIGKIFKSLTNYISKKYNCYVINVPLFEEELSMESKAAFFHDEICQKIQETDKKLLLAGYSTGANFAFETAKLFSNNTNVELVLIDCPTQIPKVTVTSRLIKKTIRSQELLIEASKQFSSEEDIFTRIEQTMKGLANYEVSGKLNAPIYAFQCDDNESQHDMQEWANYTEKFKGVGYLKGNHFQTLEEDNIFQIANFLNKKGSVKTSNQV